MLAIGVAVLLVMSIAPTRYTGWADVFRGPVQTTVGPVSGALSALAGWLRPGVRMAVETPPDQELLRQRDAALRELQKANARIAGLERRLGFVDAVGALVGDAVRPRRAPVIGRELAAGTVTVRGGSLVGVPEGAVAIDPVSLQLVGRVVETGPTASSVSVITAKVRGREGWISGLAFDAAAQVLTAEQQAMLPLVDLKPTGDGALESAEVSRRELLRPGAIVKLRDDAWPPHAQFLVLGQIVAVEDAEEPLMCVVRVQPLVDDLGSLPTLEVLMPVDRRGDSASGTAGGTAGGGR